MFGAVRCVLSAWCVPSSPYSMAQEQAGVGNAVPFYPRQAEERHPPTPALQERQQLEHGARRCLDSNGGGASNGGAAAAAAAIVTPDEVLTLGVLALAGLWHGCWSGIAAIIVHKVEAMAGSGAVDAPFQRCARSLVDLLLRDPGEATLAAEAWQHLADAQARLPDELGQVLSLACSLLQRRSLEASGTLATRKRRRAFRSDRVAARAATTPQVPAPCATALLAMISDVAREQEEQELEDRRKRQRELEGSAVPRLLPPSEVLPLLLQQPQPPPPASASAEAAQPQPQPPMAASASPGPAPAPPDQLIPEQSQLSGQPYSAAASVGGTEAEFPVLLPHSASSAPASPRPAVNWEMNNGVHHGPQGSGLMSPPREADYSSHMAAAASGPVVASPTSEAVRDANSSVP